MRNTMFISGLLGSLMGGWGSTAVGQMPANQTVSFKMHSNPADPNSAVDFTVTLSLTATEISSGSVGWTVSEIQFVRPGVGGAPDQSWAVTFPIVLTADGLWWVQHADPAAPEVSEFSLPPYVAGVASALDPADEDLSYALQGHPYSPPPGGAPFLRTAALSYAMVLVDTETPVKGGNDEPVESAGATDPL